MSQITLTTGDQLDNVQRKEGVFNLLIMPTVNHGTAKTYAESGHTLDLLSLYLQEYITYTTYLERAQQSDQTTYGL